MEGIRTKVAEFKTKHPQGFLPNEIKELLKGYPEIDMERFNEALNGITCIGSDDGTIIYHSDILNAMLSGMDPNHKGWWD